MSANAALVFYGVRFEIGEDDLEACEGRSRPYIVNARCHGLAHFWENFGGDDERFLLFIGTRLACLGPENSTEVRLGATELTKLMKVADGKLLAAGFEETPELFMQWMPDS